MPRLALMAGWFVSAFAFPRQQSQSQVSYQAALLRLRDTLVAVEAAAGEFNRDLRVAGAQTVLVRAEHLRRRCENGIVAADSTRRELRSASAIPRLQARHAALGDAMATLQRELARECVTPFRSSGPGSWADSLRAWGPYRGGQIADAIRVYNRQAVLFAGAAGFRLEPRVPAR